MYHFAKIVIAMLFLDKVCEVFVMGVKKKIPACGNSYIP